MTPATDSPSPTGSPAPTPPPTAAAAATGQQAARDAAAGVAAVGFMTAFARPDLSAPAWWAGVKPLLDAHGQMVAEGTDPSRIPVHQVTGPATVADVVVEDARTVTVPTDIGDYNIDLSYDQPRSRWLVSKYSPPPGVK